MDRDTSGEPTEERLTGGGRTEVHRRGDVVHRAASPSSPTVLAFLRHLADRGFAAAPKVIGGGFDAPGRETLSYIEGTFVHPGPWSAEACFEIGGLLRQLHEASASFHPPPGACWAPWFGRDLGDYRRVVGHCDFAPWNVVARDGRPVGLIDWDTAGPVDALVELGHVCWLNAQLHDDDVAAKAGLASPAERASHLARICDGYGLSRKLGEALVDRMIQIAVLDAADEAMQASAEPTGRALFWNVAWRTRAAGWMIRHRSLLCAAVS